METVFWLQWDSLCQSKYPTENNTKASSFMATKGKEGRQEWKGQDVVGRKMIKGAQNSLPSFLLSSFSDSSF